MIKSSLITQPSWKDLMTAIHSILDVDDETIQLAAFSGLSYKEIGAFKKHFPNFTLRDLEWLCVTAKKNRVSFEHVADNMAIEPVSDGLIYSTRLVYLG